MNPEAALEELKRIIPLENYISEDGSAWLTVGEVIEKYTSVGDSVFDFGSGACDKTAMAQLMGRLCSATDDLQDDWYKKGDKISKIELFAHELKIDFSREFTPPKKEHYKMIMMNDVIEHIHDSPRELLNLLVAGLQPGGLFFCTVPNLANIRKRIDLLRGRSNLADFDMYYWYRGVWRGPQREYVRKDLESLSSNLGLEILNLSTTHHMLENLPNYAHPAYKLVTSVFPDWRDTWVLVAKKPIDWKPKLEISDTEFAQIYGRSSNESLYS